ncbi:ABC transporter substrate-binding protein [Limnochorda pilosa]|uniref:ABC transporter substrate-binding protein n=1 Tax=Limnochorda pilosa TaxID=1555112 RepID=A0A0K2SKQ5_LIMPI|nr:ABC transporter substrate-binding protein [Limnochorda pilosa]BAS27686.1 ABC transporter substrate-binding protein [Limnochorda pilosa]
MKRWFALVLSAALFGALSAGAWAQAVAPVVEQVPEIGRYGGTLRTGQISDPKTFNYYLYKESSSDDVLQHVFEGLVSVDGVTTEVVPSLAYKWDVSDDGLTYTFYLRKGIKWHDGQELTADDVIFSYDLTYDEDIPNNFRDGLLVAGEPLTYEKVDDYTVRFHLPDVFVPILRQIGVPIVPKHILGPAYENGTFSETWSVATPASEIIGTGPYRMVDYRQGEYVLFQRNPNYWQVDQDGNQLPYLTRLVIRSFDTLESMDLAFRNGDLDVMALPASKAPEYQELISSGRLHAVLNDAGPTFDSQFVVFNQNPNSVPQPKVDWFRNVKFRQAVSYAMDRQSIADAIYNGMATPAYGPESPANALFYTPNVAQYPYDLEKAAAVLAEAGFVKGNDGVLRDAQGNAVEFSLLTNAGNTQREAIGNLLSEDLGKLGIKVNFQPIDFNVLVDHLLSGEGWDAIIIGLTGGGIDPNGGRNTWHSSGGLHMWWPNQEKPATEWEAEIDRIFDEGVKILDEQERVEFYYRYQEIAGEQQPLIYTVVPNSFQVYVPELKNYRPTAYAANGFFEAMWNLEQLWLDR